MAVIRSARPQLNVHANYMSVSVINPYRFGGGGPSYLYSENFEAPGYQNTWNTAGTGTKTPDYTTSPAPLQGSYSLRLLFSSQNGTAVSALSSPQGTLEWYFMVNFPSLPAAGKVWGRLRDASTNKLLGVEIGTSNRLVVRHGTVAASTTNALSANTTYHIWVRYVKGSGANGAATIAFSTDGTRPLSGNAFASLSTGTSTADVNDFSYGTENTSTWEAIIDKIRGNSTPIGDNPS